MKNLYYLFILSFLLISCEEEIPPVTYTLTTQVSPEGAGTINPSSGTFDENSDITISASSSSTFSFKEWTGTLSGTENPITFNITSNQNITAVFELIDADKDGVTDELDKCPETPAGTSVNVNGCPDLDGDGVSDDIDLCPDTTEGESVDDSGCSNTKVYGISNDGTELYKIGVTDGSLTLIHTFSEYLGWEFYYMPSRNEIYSSYYGKGIVSYNFETNEEKIFTFIDDVSVERFVVVDDKLIGYVKRNNDLVEIKEELASNTAWFSFVDKLDGEFYGELHYLPSRNEILIDTDGGNGIFSYNLETRDQNIQNYSENVSIERLVVINDSTLYGYNNDDDKLYEIKENGIITEKLSFSKSYYWDLHYIPSRNEIITSDEGKGIVLINLETGEEIVKTFSEVDDIERLIVIN